MQQHSKVVTPTSYSAHNKLCCQLSLLRAEGSKKGALFGITWLFFRWSLITEWVYVLLVLVQES